MYLYRAFSQSTFFQSSLTEIIVLILTSLYFHALQSHLAYFTFCYDTSGQADCYIVYIALRKHTVCMCINLDILIQLYI